MGFALQTLLFSGVYILAPVLVAQAAETYDPRLTSVGVFQTYVATHLAADKVDPQHRGALMYAQKLGQLWEKEIKSSSRQSSEEIIRKLITKDQFLSRHPKVWEGLNRPYGNDRILATPSFGFLFKSLMNAEKSSEPEAQWEDLRRSFIAGMSSDQDAVFLKRLGSNLTQSSNPKIRVSGEQLVRHAEHHPILRAASDVIIAPNKGTAVVKAGKLVAQEVAQVGRAVGKFAAQNKGKVIVAADVGAHAYVAHSLTKGPSSNGTDSAAEFSFTPNEIAENLSSVAHLSTQRLGDGRIEDTTFAPHEQSPEKRSLMELEKPGSQNWVGIITDFETKESPPPTSALDRDLAFNRVRDLVKEIRRQQALTKEPNEKIRILRQAALDAGLADYRKNRRSMSEALLGAGGNCESQTRLLTALLKDHPDLLPQGYSLRIYTDPSHVAPVIFDGKTNLDLVSGKITDDSNQEVTYLRPEALLMGIARQDPKLRSHPKLDPKNAYIKGRPEERDFATDSFRAQVRRFLDSSRYSPSDTTMVAHQSAFTEFPSIGTGTPDHLVPEKAKITYQEPRSLTSPGGSSSLVPEKAKITYQEPRSLTSPGGSSSSDLPFWLQGLAPISEKNEVAEQLGPDRFPEIHCEKARPNSPPFLSLTQAFILTHDNQRACSIYPIERKESRILGNPASTKARGGSQQGVSFNLYPQNPWVWFFHLSIAQASVCMLREYNGHFDFVGTPSETLPLSTTPMRAVIRMAEGPLCNSLRQTLGTAVTVGGEKGQEILWNQMFQLISQEFKKIDEAYESDRAELKSRADKKLQPLLPADLSQRLQMHYSKKFYWAQVGLAMGFPVKREALWIKEVQIDDLGTITRPEFPPLPAIIKQLYQPHFSAVRLRYDKAYSTYLDPEMNHIVTKLNPLTQTTTQFLREVGNYLLDDPSPSSIDFKANLGLRQYEVANVNPVKFIKPESGSQSPCPEVSLPRVGPLPADSWPLIPATPCSTPTSHKGKSENNSNNVDRRALLYAYGETTTDLIRLWDEKTSEMMVEKLKNPDVVRDPYTGRPVALRAYGVSSSIDWNYDKFKGDSGILRSLTLRKLFSNLRSHQKPLVDDNERLNDIKAQYPRLGPLVDYLLSTTTVKELLPLPTDKWGGAIRE